MTDDEKLGAAFLFMGLFVAQIICVVVLTFALGTATPADIPVGSPRQWLSFAPALVAIPLATLFFASKPPRRSGKWVWVPGVLHFLYGTFYRGFGQAPKLSYLLISGEEPILTVLSVLSTAFILYSLTMFAMSQLTKRLDPQGESVASPEEKGPEKVLGQAPPST